MKIPFVKASTQAYFRDTKAHGLPVLERIHGYVYGKWCYHYIGLAGDKDPWWQYLWAPLVALVDWMTPFFPSKENQVGDPDQKKPTWGDTYHGKVMPAQEASKLVKLDRVVNTEIPEQVLPYTRAREVILRNPEKIVLLDCPCRAGMKNPCTPIDVCILVGDPFASFMLEHHPDRTREITPEEAMRIIRQEQARGHVSHAFFKDVMLGRFYAICNCCSCCCGAMKSHAKGVHMLCHSGYLATIDEEACVKCGVCAQKCQFKAIGFNKDSAYIRTDNCMGCGVCVASCAKDAIKLELAPEKGEPLLVDNI